MKDHTIKTKRTRRAHVLLPKNNFIVGLGSVLNLAGRYFEYKYSKSEEEADYNALRSDWENIGDDIRKSEAKFNEDLCLK